MYTYYFFKLLLFSYTTTKNGWNLFLISPPKKLNLTCWLYGISLSVPITLRDVWECVSTLLLGRYNFAAALFSKSLIMRIEKYLHSQKWIMQTPILFLGKKVQHKVQLLMPHKTAQLHNVCLCLCIYNIWLSIKFHIKSGQEHD